MSFSQPLEGKKTLPQELGRLVAAEALPICKDYMPNDSNYVTLWKRQIGNSEGISGCQARWGGGINRKNTKCP